MLAGPAVAQTVPDYATLLQTFGPALFGGEADVHLKAIDELVDSAEGRWVALTAIAPDGLLPDRPAIELACGRIGIDLRRTGAFSFETVRTGPRATLEARWTYVGNGAFQRQVDEGALLEYLFGNFVDMMNPAQLLGILSSGHSSTVTVLMPGPDYLVLIGHGHYGEIWGRCPAP